tara:strand:+ start:600 stop:794 length:195 start_codon:yes stop_codon:yes gene_type:complete
MPIEFKRKRDKEIRDFKKSASDLRKLRNKKGTAEYNRAVTKFRKEAREMRQADKAYKKSYKFKG